MEKSYDKNGKRLLSAMAFCYQPKGWQDLKCKIQRIHSSEDSFFFFFVLCSVEAAWSSEMQVNNHHTTWPNNS
jgi:hypothetical protein